VDLNRISEELEDEFSAVPPLKISRLNRVDRTPIIGGGNVEDENP
ncbi:MAG: hypothetical protein HKO85_05360, partial [Xanthomonadales bacterium]|nr:hypothetical protein [Xanthomonadales bacterium]